MYFTALLSWKETGLSDRSHLQPFRVNSNLRSSRSTSAFNKQKCRSTKIVNVWDVYICVTANSICMQLNKLNNYLLAEQETRLRNSNARRFYKQRFDKIMLIVQVFWLCSNTFHWNFWVIFKSVLQLVICMKFSHKCMLCNLVRLRAYSNTRDAFSLKMKAVSIPKKDHLKEIWSS